MPLPKTIDTEDVVPDPVTSRESFRRAVIADRQLDTGDMLKPLKEALEEPVIVVGRDRRFEPE